MGQNAFDTIYGYQVTTFDISYDIQHYDEYTPEPLIGHRRVLRLAHVGVLRTPQGGPETAPRAGAAEGQKLRYIR